MSAAPALPSLFDGYQPPACFDELFGFDQTPLEHCVPLYERLIHFPRGDLGRRAALAEVVFRDVGITFTLTADEEGTERTIPF
jgi:uncharacterized circularly permuted ATP-grasp superfamily protein